jgi:hypothetical protein
MKAKPPFWGNLDQTSQAHFIETVATAGYRLLHWSTSRQFLIAYHRPALLDAMLSVMLKMVGILKAQLVHVAGKIVDYLGRS